MKGPHGRRVTLDPVPDVQVLGDRVVVGGAAVLDAYRILAAGVETLYARDGIAPNERVAKLLAACKVAVEAVRSAPMFAGEPTNVRQEPVRPSLNPGEQLGSEEVAHMLGVSPQHVRRLGAELGGHKRSREWVFPRATVEAYRIERSARSN